MSETAAARWEEYNEAGRRSFGLGQLAEAEELFRAAVREGEQLGPDSPHLATSLNALGQLRLQAKDLAEAERCFTRALAIREQTYGPDSHAIVPSLNNLSALHDARGETDKAVELLRRSLVISDQALGGTHPEVAIALNNLAKLYFKRRDFAKADRLLLKLLDTKRSLGKDHPEVATVLGSLAKLRQAVSKHAAAEQLWRQSLAIRERAFAPNDPIIATTLENVADCCAAQEGRLADAIELRERSILIREIAMGAAHPSLTAARAKLDELRARPGAPSAQPPAIEAPPRSSLEVPSPIFSHEVPPFSAGQPAAPAPNLPWIQTDAEPTGERPPPRLELMGTEPPIELPHTEVRPRVASRTPLVPPPIPALAPGGSNALVFTDSLAPDSARAAPRRPPRAAPPVPLRAPPHPHAGPAPSRAPTRHDSAAKSRRRRSKAPFIAAFVLMLGGVAGWYTIAGRAAAAAALLDPVLERVEHAAPRITREAAARVVAARPVGEPSVSRSGSRSGSRSVSRSVSPSQATPEPVVQDPAAQAASPARRAGSDSVAHPGTAPAVIPPDVNLDAPVIPASAAIDSLTRGIEQATKSSADSAQKARLDSKTPIFRKP